MKIFIFFCTFLKKVNFFFTFLIFFFLFETIFLLILKTRKPNQIPESVAVCFLDYIIVVFF